MQQRRVKHLSLLTAVSIAASVPVRAGEASDNLERLRRALEKPAPVLSLPADTPVSKPRLTRQVPQSRPRSDSIWEGLLIGAAIGGAGGYIWARQICGGTDDTECFLISAPVGIAGGIGIRALVGAVVDKLHK
jgi:hypothetical protein